jgi:soluble lytic murein transglycosylase-like protein
MWQHPDRDREKVRRVIAGAARHHDVDPQLALAIAWQESGWQMGVVSSANAIGAMQVLPSTARWMEHYAGRPLRLRKLGDNAKAGVLLLRVLSQHTHRRTHKIGAYYQGLGAVQRHGLYDETRTYVDNVEAIKRRLEDGRPPS